MNNKKITLIMYIVSSLIYISSLILGIIAYNNNTITESHIKQILIQNSVAFIVPLIIEIGVRLFKLRMSNIIKLSILIFVLFHVFFGETLDFYANVIWWDSFLHILSGFGIAFIFFLLLVNLTKKFDKTSKIIICVFVSTMFSITLAFFWEIIEFTTDSLFNTNMQRFIPTLEDLNNGGFSNNPLQGTNDQIAEFYKTPEGYKYALMDTMKDLVLCLLGNIISGILIFILVYFEKTNRLQKIITYIPKEENN